jgi:predicted nucleotidyltransferase
MRTRSSATAGAVYLDRAARLDALRAAARRARTRQPAIERVILCGSLAAGLPTPRSDADLLVVLAASEEPLGRERVPALLAALSPLPCSIDLVAFTIDELERARAAGDPLVREALATGIDLI